MPKQNKYDVIIAGSGAAGLSLVMHMIKHNYHIGKKILLIDSDKKKSNDRTWCFWEDKAGLFEPVVYKKWDKIFVADYNSGKHLSISPFTYKMLRGIDFYNYCFDEIKKHPEIEFVNDRIQQIDNLNDGVEIITTANRYKANICFSSLPFGPDKSKSNAFFFLQHFKGWIIKSNKPRFDTVTATFMDFRVDQKNDTRFVYVLPLTQTTALVEFTVFSENLLAEKEYEAELRKYIENIIGETDFEILETEYGVIPMTDYNFKTNDGNVFYIGTSGGQTKASTGFTFKFIQQQSQRIVQQLVAEKKLNLEKNFAEKRFDFYDSTLLRILSERKLNGSFIFKTMFDKNKPADVLRFLGNKTTLADELRIFVKLPVFIFAKAALNQIFKK
ncbi:MAG TPA: lycopene cyclase family protein [Bacteroidia bacterium]|nr:lycopene cyclase family protein [Bacteroidia bacterium]HNU34073.1 lycopene cyclase family protein [Bacteroidia bacterium]